MLVLNFPFLPFLINNSKTVGTKRIFDKKTKRTQVKSIITKNEKAREFCRLADLEILFQVPRETVLKLELEWKKKPLSITYELHSPVFSNKDNSPNLKAGDWDGFPKILQDRIFNIFDSIDDGQIREAKVVLITSPETRTIVKISQLSL